MKRTICTLLALAAALTLLNGCGETKPSGDNVPADVKLEDVVSAIRDAYGDDYIPNMQMDEERLENVTGVKPDWVEEFIAEEPMISINVDMLIAIEAKEGQADTVEKSLNDYYRYLVNDSVQYPSNIEKVRAARIVRRGDYVFFFTLGSIPLELTDKEDQTDAYNAAVANNQKAADVISAMLGA